MRTIFENKGRSGTVEDTIIIDYLPKEGFVSIKGMFHDYDQYSDRGNYLNGSGILKITDDAFLDALAKARSGDFVVLGDPLDNKLEIWRQKGTRLILGNGELKFQFMSDWHLQQGSSLSCMNADKLNFLFLDSLSVIEDGYSRKKSPRDIELGIVEKSLLNISS